ncbi:hypothetical protein DL96DRAFT_1550960 [Flagelloscypha sp. PMI_526]|nr:hypothetical protein DL96DRAFT_1550960 [Flagelloscypha sp. PMI_526]
MVAFFLHFLTPLGLSSLVTALALVPHGNSLVRERGFMPHSTARHGWSSPHTRGKKNDDDDELQQGPPEALQAEENEWSTPDSQPPPRLSVLKRQRSETPRHDYALDAVSPEVPGAAPRHDYAFDLITPNLPATPPTRPRRSQDFNRFSRQPPYLDNATSSKPGVRQVAGSEEPSEANIPPVGLSLQAKKIKSASKATNLTVPYTRTAEHGRARPAIYPRKHFQGFSRTSKITAHYPGSSF